MENMSSRATCNFLSRIGDLFACVALCKDLPRTKYLSLHSPMSLPLAFQAKRGKPELVVPAKPTPYEVKNLSNIDTKSFRQYRLAIINFYRYNDEMEGRDPAKIIKEATANTLVHYYPFAGRLRRDGEGRPNDILVVECTGEGVMFVEADANVRLDQFGYAPQPPFPKDLHYDGPGSGCVLNSPLLLIQVTRLMCGGFTFSIQFTHTMSDGTGIGQFMKAIGEMACGACVPSVQPVWKRELLKARDQPLEGVPNELLESNGKAPYDINAQLTCRSFFFGPKEVLALKNRLPPHLHGVTRFELLTAFLWKCRTIALNVKPSDKVVLIFAMNARKKFSPPLPVGYYGNAIVNPVAVSTAKELCCNQLGYAVELVKRAKKDVTDDFMRALPDVFARIKPYEPSSYIVSDVTSIRFQDVDFGWGKAVYAGLSGDGNVATTFIMSSKNNKGEDGVVATLSLPEHLLERFAMHVDEIIGESNHYNSVPNVSNPLSASSFSLSVESSFSQVV